MRYTVLSTCECQLYIPRFEYSLSFEQHIYYLCCTAEESHLLPARLRAFFPGLSQNDSDSLLGEQFHWDFTDQERENLNEAGRQTVEFLKEEAGWEENRETFWKENGWVKDYVFFITLCLNAPFYCTMQLVDGQFL